MPQKLFISQNPNNVNTIIWLTCLTSSLIFWFSPFFPFSSIYWRNWGLNSVAFPTFWILIIVFPWCSSILCISYKQVVGTRDLMEFRCNVLSGNITEAMLCTPLLPIIRRHMSSYLSICEISLDLVISVSSTHYKVSHLPFTWWF